MTFREFMSENGYTVQTTFWEDFTIADLFGLSAIRDTYNRAFFGSITRAVLKLQHFTMTYGSRQTGMQWRI